MADLTPSGRLDAVRDHVAIGAILDVANAPTPGAAALWRVLVRSCDGDIAAALGTILLRISQLEREVVQ